MRTLLEVLAHVDSFLAKNVISMFIDPDVHCPFALSNVLNPTENADDKFTLTRYAVIDFKFFICFVALEFVCASYLSATKVEVSAVTWTTPSFSVLDVRFSDDFAIFDSFLS